MPTCVLVILRVLKSTGNTITAPLNAGHILSVVGNTCAFICGKNNVSSCFLAIKSTWSGGVTSCTSGQCSSASAAVESILLSSMALSVGRILLAMGWASFWRGVLGHCQIFCDQWTSRSAYLCKGPILVLFFWLLHLPWGPVPTFIPWSPHLSPGLPLVK